MGSQALMSVLEMMAMLMRSTGRYVHLRIETVHGKEAYRIAMKECIQHVMSDLSNLEMIKFRIKHVADEAEHLYPKRMFNGRQEERRCHQMAVDQALEIVTNLEKRFILGQSDDAPRTYKDKGFLLYEDESLFG